MIESIIHWAKNVLLALSVAGAGFIPQCALPTPTGDLIDENTVHADTRDVKYLLNRLDGKRAASFVYVSPGSGGGMMGHALYLFENGKMVYAKFQPFARAIEYGNDFVMNGVLPRSLSVAQDDDTQASGDIPASLAGGVEYVLGDAHMYVTPNKYPLLTGYHVVVSMENTYIITIYKDCNNCAIYTQTTAVDRAMYFLDILQGWS